MKLLSKIIFSLLIFFSVPTYAFAATYYVSPNGNDSNAGTQMQPWKTIQKSANSVAAGDVVIINPGSYNENITISRSGTSTSPIVFRGLNNPVIVQSTPTNTSCLNTVNNSCLLGVLSITGSNVVFKNMEVAGAPIKPGVIAGITLSGSYDEISGNFVHNTYKEGIKITSGNNNSLLRNYITYGVVSGIYFDGTNHLIEGNTITHSVTRGPDRVFFSASSDPDGIRFFGSGTIVQGNTIKDIYLDETLESDGPHSDCFQTWGNASNITFEKNYCELENTTTYVDPMVKFMMIERLSGYAAVSGIKIINNIFVSNNNATQWSPIQIGGTTCSTSTPLSDFTVANNTFVHTGSVIGDFAILLRCTNTISIKNNVLYNYAHTGYRYIQQDLNNNTGVDISNNSIYNTDGSIPSGGAYPGDNIAETWLKDPKFVNIGSLDLHLSSTSPLINRGIAIAGVATDFDGTSRPQGTAYDIGAYEYSGSAPSTPPTITPTNTPAPTSTGVPTPGTINVCTSGCTHTTIQAAVNAAAPGDIIEVQTGTYPESVTIGKNGTSNAWITLRAKTGNAVWIDGSSLGNVSNINIGNHSYWNVIGLKMRNAAQGSASGADGTADAVTAGAGANNITLQGLTIETPNADGIDLRGANYNIQVLDNIIYDMRKNNPNYNGDGHGIHVLQQTGVSTSHDILVKGNYIHDAHGKACLALSDFTALNATAPYNIIFEYNKVQDCTNGIKINADGIFRYNLVVDTGKYTTGVEKPDSCFQAFTHDAENNVRNGQIYNNTTVGCSNSYNFDMVYNVSTPTQTFTVFRNNIAYNPRTYFVRVTGTNLTSDGNNLFYKAGGGGSYIGFTPDASSIINTDPQLNNDYTLKSISPAIDKGSLVYSGQVFSGNAPDIGAFESGSTTSTPTSTPIIKPGDANGDGKVDETDYGIWLSHFGQTVTGGKTVGDFNTDGRIDGVDYTIWLVNNS